jgi:hypothetical protein
MLDPDHCFQQNGVSFVIQSAVINNFFHWILEYDNCFDSDCRLTVALVGFDSDLKHAIKVECSAGAAGRVAFAWPVPSSSQGKLERFHIYADVSRPGSKGERLRVPIGQAVRCPGISGNEFALNLLFGLVGAHLIQDSPLMEVDFPQGVATALPGQTPSHDALLPPVVQYLVLAAIVGLCIFGLAALFWKL